MNPTIVAMLRALVRASRPWLLLAGVLLYAIGGGISNYLGYTVLWPVYWLGQGAITMLQLSSYLLREYFDRANQPPFEQIARRRPKPDVQEAQKETGNAQKETPDTIEVIVPRLIFFQLAAVTLTTGAVMTVLLYAARALNPAAFVILGIAFLLSMAYAVPPFRLVYTGYGELIQAILLANFLPALAYLLQAGQLHRLLAMLTFPLTFLTLATFLARSLRGYLEDIRQQRQTMLVRVGWQRGMTLHNALLAMAYLALVLLVFIGLPVHLALPAFLSLPVGVFQIWQMNAIANGGKPRWRLLDYTALATLGLAVYFLAFALWTG